MAGKGNQALQLQLLQRLLSEKQPLAECARALQAVLSADPQVRSVWYFTWQQAGIYSPEGDVRGWPPQYCAGQQHRLLVSQTYAAGWGLLWRGGKFAAVPRATRAGGD